MGGAAGIAEHAQAAATRGDVSREWRFPRDPPFFPCAVCVVSTRIPSQVTRCKKQNTKRSCSIALSSSFRIPYSPRRSDKRRSFFLRLHSSALAWKDPLGASPFLPFAHCSRNAKKNEKLFMPDSSQFTLWFRLIRKSADLISVESCEN